MMNRREFAGACAGVVSAAALQAAPLGLPIGCQTYPVREALGKDFEGTLRQLAAIGYKTIEMCSPPGYARSGYGALVGMKAAEMRKIVEGAGLACTSCHYQFRELKENLRERMDFALELGMKQMILASFGIRPEAPMSDWIRAADDMNKAGEQARKDGIQIGFHNHNGEFKEIGGVLIYDQLLKTFDPQLVKMQFQVSVLSVGVEPVSYLSKYPGRFASLHLQDWSPAEKKTVAVGKGAVDWKKLFAAAKTGGVKNYFVELNLNEMKESYPYLRSLNV
ncbi:MAG: sugar phosphate isomerase/epimerase [Candidatus Solibacter usitatus]|nr:sugar phosphate isomerase/epimerase [Candidatus Solibacter usitatus]